MNSTEALSLTDFTEKAYLDYSMYVILDRALPHIADGFKPVQRRIIYAMSELGLKSNAKHKKSARTVGDVLGKFHPHGDQACYEAMVLMAQSFSYRYPFVDGQGNWGSPDDPKSFAAMRYTEAKLSSYADLLLSELQKGTVDWVDNFDASLKEPSLLPARLPNILLNGATGIAVGMSCDILPHNLTEVANACIHLLDHPESTLKEIMHFIKGPDFPTTAEIISPHHALMNMYQEGIGSIKMRAVYQIEDHQLIITALPYQVSGAKIMEQIALQMQQKKLPMIDDLRDESDHEHPTRLVIIPRSHRINLDEIMSHLFATTDLERSYRANFNMIGLNGKPSVKGLIPLLKEWLHFRLVTVKKRTQHRLNQVLERLHLVEGLWIAYLNIDEIIHIIRYEDDPKSILMTRFKLSALQADAILDLKLRHLAKLEEIKLTTERDALNEERQYLELLLSSPSDLKQAIKNELIADRDQYGDSRRSPMIARGEAQAIKEEQLIPNEPITIILSEKGWIRAAKGHEINGEQLTYKTGDHYKTQIYGRSNQLVFFFDSEGKVYSLPAHTLPSARGQGEPLTGKLNPNDQATFSTLTSGELDDWIVLATDMNYGFMTQLKMLVVKNKNGKNCLTLPQNAVLLHPQQILSSDHDSIAAFSNTGRLLIFKANELPVLSRGKGTKIMGISTQKTLSKEEFLSAILPLQPQDGLVVQSGKRSYTIKPEDRTPYLGKRGQRGRLLPRGFQQVSHVSIIKT